MQATLKTLYVWNLYSLFDVACFFSHFGENCCSGLSQPIGSHRALWENPAVSTSINYQENRMRKSFYL